MSDEIKIKINKEIIIISIIALLVIGIRILFFIQLISLVTAAPQCSGAPTPCSSFGTQATCTTCGCTWTLASENKKINIGDVWKTVTAVYINVGDVWKTVTFSYINIGDVWKPITTTNSCSGTPTPCSGYEEADCESCGCAWSP